MVNKRSQSIFKELRDISKYNTIKINFDTVEWENESDIDLEISCQYNVKLEE